MNKITLIVEDDKLTPDAFNNIMHFVQRYYADFGADCIDFIFEVQPVQLCGKISKLTSLGKQAFRLYNKENAMRNIHLIKPEGNNERT